MKRYLQAVFGLALVSGSVCAGAQGTPIYRLQGPDGRTVYSDKILPQTKVQKEVAASEVNVVAPLASGKEAQETDTRLNTQVAKRDELWRARNSAQARLDAARRAKVDGEEPRAGERIGTASGRSRLNDSYWERQDALQRAIDNAQRDLERAELNLRAAGS